MIIGGSELSLFNSRTADNHLLLEGFPIDMYHIMPRMIHLSKSKGSRTSSRHKHHIWEFNLILNGQMEFFWDNKSAQLVAGDIFFMPPNSLHGWKMLSPDFMILGLQTSISYIGGNNVKLKNQLLDAMERVNHHIHGCENIPLAAWSMIETILTRPAFYREFAHLNLRSIYLKIFSRLFPNSLGYEADNIGLGNNNIFCGGKKIAEILEYYINDNMGKPLKVSEVCERFRISKSQLNRICLKDTGMTTSDYIASGKMAMAKHLLEKTERMVKEIAVLTGYPNVNYFCRLFKKITGMTPEEYRNKNR